jgi:hypothetical protein
LTQQAKTTSLKNGQVYFFLFFYIPDCFPVIPATTTLNTVVLAMADSGKGK